MEIALETIQRGAEMDILSSIMMDLKASEYMLSKSLGEGGNSSIKGWDNLETYLKGGKSVRKRVLKELFGTAKKGGGVFEA
jgi:hypothetical protein